MKSDLAGEDLHEQLLLFSDIAHEYDNYKEVGEGWQACDFMCFLLKHPGYGGFGICMSIRRAANPAKMFAGCCFGRGRTGKSTLETLCG